MQWALWLLAAFAGFLMPVQSGVNGALNRALERPSWVVLTSLGVSVVVTLLVGIVFRLFELPPAGAVARAPWWAWIGGFCGAIVVLSQPLAAPKLGAAAYIGITVTTSALGSVLLDHFGLLGFAQHTASAGRLAGAALMIAGIVLIAKF